MSETERGRRMKEDATGKKHMPYRGPSKKELLQIYNEIETSSVNTRQKCGINAKPKLEDALQDERFHRVIDRLCESGVHHRAIKQFFKGTRQRNFNTCSNNMSLYERIMTYRTIKEDEEEKAGDEEHQSTSQSQQVAVNTNLVFSQTSTQDADSTNRRHVERSDTFSSIDISHFTGLEDEEFRSPSPQPTFDDHYWKKRGQEEPTSGGHISESKTDTVPDGGHNIPSHTTQKGDEDWMVNQPSYSKNRATSNHDKEIDMTTLPMSDMTGRKENEELEIKSHNTITSSIPVGHSYATSQDDKHTHLEMRTAHQTTASGDKEERSASPFNTIRSLTQNEAKNMVAVLEKLADDNLSHILGSSTADHTTQISEAEKRVLDKAFSPKFQADLDQFLNS